MINPVNPTSSSKNLGQVAAIVYGTVAPNNKNLVWIDTTTNPPVKKEYNYTSGAWEASSGGGGGVISANQKTPIVITDGSPKTITWATDIPDGEIVTYLVKHGAYPIITEENQNDDGTWNQNASASYVWNTARTILTLTPQTVKANFIIL